MTLLLNAKGPKVLEASNLKMDDKNVPGIYTYIIISYIYTYTIYNLICILYIAM